MIKGVIKKIEVTRDEDHTQEINPLNEVCLLCYQLKNKWTSNFNCSVTN
jgi:hypothetical protein